MSGLGFLHQYATFMCQCVVSTQDPLSMLMCVCLQPCVRWTRFVPGCVHAAPCQVKNDDAIHTDKSADKDADSVECCHGVMVAP